MAAAGCFVPRSRSESSGRWHPRLRSWRSALRVGSPRREGSCCSCSLQARLRRIERRAPGLSGSLPDAPARRDRPDRERRPTRRDRRHRCPRRRCGRGGDRVERLRDRERLDRGDRGPSARRLGSSPARADRMAFIRRALPLGFVSVMSSAYFTVDLVLLGWLVSGPELGSLRSCDQGAFAAHRRARTIDGARRCLQSPVRFRTRRRCARLPSGSCTGLPPSDCRPAWAPPSSPDRSSESPSVPATVRRCPWFGSSRLRRRSRSS